jgi:hypothetical protein
MAWIDKHLDLDPALLARIAQTEEEIAWVREASAQDLFDVAMTTLGLRTIECPFGAMTAMELGDMPHSSLVAALEPYFEQGTTTASDVADQIQLCRAFSDPAQAMDTVLRLVEKTVAKFPTLAEHLKVGHNPGDVLDPFILAANHQLLSGQSMEKMIEYSIAHKVLMKIENLIGNLHQETIGLMRGNFRAPEPKKGKGSVDKGRLHPYLNPFPGADIGQAPIPGKPDTPRLFQVKNKTGSSKGGGGKSLGEQLRLLEQTYRADTFYVAIVGTTLSGHRSRTAVVRESPNTVLLVGKAAIDELTQTTVGDELLLRTYRRAFRQAAQSAEYRFGDVVAAAVEVFEREAAEADDDFPAGWLRNATEGRRADQDSRASEQQDRLL